MVSQTLLSDLRRDEGLRLSAYPDPLTRGSPFTIGYGHTGHDVTPHTNWTREQADAALLSDAAHAEGLCDRYIPWWRTLDQVRQDVLANMMFNMGWDNLATAQHEGLSGFHNTLEFVRTHDYVRAALGLSSSLWARQTGARAQRLVHMMQTGMRA